MTNIPCAFIEVGCSEKEWADKKACYVVASSILDCFSNFNSDFKCTFGVGGSHYASEFSKIQLNSGIAISHILPKYFDDSLSIETFNQLISRTKEKLDFVLLDKQSLTKFQINLIESYCSKLGISLIDVRSIN